MNEDLTNKHSLNYTDHWSAHNLTALVLSADQLGGPTSKSSTQRTTKAKD